MTQIISGFSERLNSLDTSLPSEGMFLYGGARAYRDNDLPYIDNIHFRPQNESWMMHEKVQRAIINRAEYQGGIYAGTAGRVNIDYIAASKAPAAILYDVNPLQKVFWDKFWSRLAENDNPDDFAWAMDGFAEELYYDLSEHFNFKALRQAQLDNKSRNVIDLSPPKKNQYGEYISNYSSPFRNSGYKNFDIEFRTAAGHTDTGWTSCKDKDLNWLQNMEWFDHLHQMAKEGAIGAITLDITDQLACAELAELLRAQDQKAGLIYTSNIGHYLQWSDDEIQNHESEEGRPATDYTGKRVSGASWKAACDNLRLLCREDALVIRFDAHSGVDGPLSNFYPPFDTSGDDMRIPTVLDPGGLI